jgi:hypothetical protein
MDGKDKNKEGDVIRCYSSSDSSSSSSSSSCDEDDNEGGAGQVDIGDDRKEGEQRGEACDGEAEEEGEGSRQQEQQQDVEEEEEEDDMDFPLHMAGIADTFLAQDVQEEICLFFQGLTYK